MSLKTGHELIDAWRHGTISQPEFDELQLKLRAEPEVRALWRRMAELEESLGAIAAHSVDTTFVRAQQTGVSAVWNWIPWTIAAVLTLAFILFEVRRTSQHEPALPPALLVDEANARFTPELSPNGPTFSKGSYNLEQGAVHLRFVNGANLVIEGPARFDIQDAQHVRLVNGKARAIVPPEARGFTLVTKGVDYEDVGTEFGLRVDSTGDASFLHVFDGQVNLRKQGSGELLKSAVEGQSLQHTNGNIQPQEQPAPGEFVSPGSIGHIRWKAGGGALVNNPNIIAFFDFQPSADRSVLANVVPNSPVPDAQISGAQWVSGRWPQKDALLFDKDEDFVEVEVPGEFNELSVATWIFADRFDHEMNAVFNSNQAPKGGLHLQLTRTGLARGGIQGVQDTKSWPGPEVRPGRWTHIAEVVSMVQGTQTIYVNGMLAMESKIIKGVPIQPATARIGNWLPTKNYSSPRRAFRGRIDELAIWNRALSQSEIRSQIASGQPNLIWSKEAATAPTILGVARKE